MKYAVIDEKKGAAGLHTAQLLVRSVDRDATREAIQDYLWRDEWYTFQSKVQVDEALRMSKVVLSWQPRRVVCPKLGTNGGEVGENWGLWWYGGVGRNVLRPYNGNVLHPDSEDGVPLRIHLEQCGLMVNRNTGAYPSVVYLHEVTEREVTLRGYGQDRYLVRLTGWQAVPVGYLIMV